MMMFQCSVDMGMESVLNITHMIIYLCLGVKSDVDLIRVLLI